jgi:hypothetical protein
MTGAGGLLAVGLPMMLASSAGRAPAPTPPVGFVRTAWAPLKGNGFRVNSRDAKTGPFRNRWEAKQTGLMKIAVEPDPAEATAARLDLELWGGHPGVANKRFTLNGKSTYPLPEVGAAKHNCCYSYPSVPLKLAELRRGENALQFTCDKAAAFWGHYLIRAACVRLTQAADSPPVREAKLETFSARVVARPAADAEAIQLSLDVPDAMVGRIASVEYRGRYTGYDENGDGRGDDWHGFTKDRKPMGIVGVAAEPPFGLAWDLTMVPDQKDLAVRAVVRFRDAPNLAYHTAPVSGLKMPRRAGKVTLHYARDLPRPFWSRAGRVRKCTIDLDVAPASVERAELRALIWDGGRGSTRQPFTLNGHALAVAGRGAHDVLYRVLPVEPKALHKGANEIRLLSDTTHHGIEVILPGPALIVRTRRR